MPWSLPRRFDRDAAIVEDAEARRAVARRVMQPADRNEGAARGPGDDRGERLERPADDGRRGFIDPGKRRRIAGIEKTTAALRQLDDAIDVLRRVEILELGARRLPRRPALEARSDGRLLEPRHERAVTIGAERVAVRKPVTGDLGTRDQND